jgi:hypothetical protein
VKRGGPVAPLAQRNIAMQAGAATFDSIFSLVILVLAATLVGILHSGWTAGSGTGEVGSFYTSPCDEQNYKNMSIGLIVVSGFLLLLTILIGIIAFACAANKKAIVLIMTIVSIACWATILGLGGHLLRKIVQNDAYDTRCVYGGHYDTNTASYSTGYLYLLAKATGAVAVATSSMMLIYQIFHLITSGMGGRR